MIFLCGIWMIFPDEVDIPPETNELPEDGAEMTASAYILILMMLIWKYVGRKIFLL